MNNLVFSLRNVGKSRPGADGFCLHIDGLDVVRGSLQALVGPSGCGKSTALDLLAGILRPDAEAAAGAAGSAARVERAVQTGSAALAESAEPVEAPSRRERRFLFSPTPNAANDMLEKWRKKDLNSLARLRQRHLGYVQQTGGLLPFLTARDNIMLRCSSLGCVTERSQQIQGIVDGLGIGRLLEHYPATLSVGERQRVAIAAALAHAPEMVLADEPTAALDPMHARNALRIFANLAQMMNITVLMVTHSLEMAVEAGFSPIQVTLDQGGLGAISRIDHRVEDSSTAPDFGQQAERQGAQP
ncbi:MAG: ATP-binding cassette domain-containing protein [Desulfovibrio sp.]|uniref:ATP-binding cassette domain-containing protein n=1 Tax=Desulfovibrio sp. TaxID=885 RepID=UPI002A358435|nr:ATP-binding cassette domain-containing protein [Desulfovibrio sp.]MDY0258342.1 ATP-binding cassette domain-containing protein [Desulfovibrio sp.]